MSEGIALLLLEIPDRLAAQRGLQLKVKFKLRLKGYPWGDRERKGFLVGPYLSQGGG